MSKYTVINIYFQIYKSKLYIEHIGRIEGKKKYLEIEDIRKVLLCF